MNKELLMKWIIFITGILCAFIFLSVRISPGMMNILLKTKTYPEFEDFTKYGELYMFSMVNDFKEDLPQSKEKFRFSRKQSGMDDADILVFGDSQLDHARYTNIPERLNDSLQKKVFYHRYIDPHWGFVLSYLNAGNYHNNGRKLLVFESAERYVSNRFMQNPDTVIDDRRTGNRKMVSDLLKKIFNTESEYLYTIYLKRSYFTSDIYSFLSTVKFKLFGLINPTTPKYALKDDRPWLFYKESIDHFNTEYSDEEMEIICNNILKLSRTVKERYNLDFVFIPIPEKYTIYHKIVYNDRESDFLKRLYDGLDQRGVVYVNLLDTFNNSRTYVYPGTDTHLNEQGSVIAYEKLMNEIKSDTTLKYLLNNSTLK